MYFHMRGRNSPHAGVEPLCGQQHVAYRDLERGNALLPKMGNKSAIQHLSDSCAACLWCDSDTQ